MGGNLAVAHGGRLVPVAERDVIGASSGKFFRMNEPRTDQAVRIAFLIDEVAVGGGKLPAGRPRPWIGKRRHVGVVEVGMAPDLQIEFVEQCGRFVIALSAGKGQGGRAS